MDADDLPAGDERYPHRDRDAAWVDQARGGDPDAFGRLYDAWFDRCHDVARRIVRDDEVAAEVAQDTFLSAWRNLDGLADPGAFGGWILRITRNQAFNRREREQRSMPVDDEGMAVMAGAAGRTLGTGDTGPAGFGVEDRLGSLDDPSRIAEDNEAAALLWGAVDALGERDAEVLNLQLRLGLTPAEVGEVLGMNRNAANQLVHRVRGRLDGAVRARVLWRDGAPACPELRAALATAGLDAFDAGALKTIEQHARACASCEERQKSRVAPAAMFAAIPVMAPILLKQQAAAALAAAGVPMGGSAFAGAGAAAGAGATGGGTTGGGPEGSGGGGTENGSGNGPTGGAAPEPAPGPVPGLAPPTAENAGRTRLLALAGVGAVVLLVVVGLLVLRGGGDGPVELVADAGTTSTSTAAKPVPGTGPGSSTTTPASTTSGPSTTERTTSTADPTTTTSAPTSTSTSTSTTSTTTPRKIAITVTVDPATVYPSWVQATGPQLTWSVTGANGLAVRVTGPASGNATATIATTATGGPMAVPCPNATTGPACSTTAGTVLTYTVEVRDGTTLVASKAATLTVVEPPIP